MKQLLWILVLVVAFFLARGLLSMWETMRAKERPDRQAETTAPAGQSKPEDLPGLPAGVEASLQKAQSQGAGAVKTWLDTYRQYVSDPRLAWIELDYVVLVSRENPQEARRVFQSVKSRTPPGSPV